MLGYTGDGEKASWIKTDLAYDWAFNYKTQDYRAVNDISRNFDTIRHYLLLGPPQNIVKNFMKLC